MMVLIDLHHGARWDSLARGGTFLWNRVTSDGDLGLDRYISSIPSKLVQEPFEVSARAGVHEWT